MTDIFTPEKRSEIMSKVKSKGTKIEVMFGKELRKRGFRYRKNFGKYFWTPDFVLKKYKTVIFLDSCFWHGCPVHGTMPETNKEMWKKKLERNKQRDWEAVAYYKKQNWNILRIRWHNVKKSTLKELVDEVIEKITSFSWK